MKEMEYLMRGTKLKTICKLKTMKRSTFIFLLLCISSINITFGQNDPDIIIWGDKALEWEDFSGQVESNSEHEASTRGQLRAPNSWNSDSLTVVITAEFIKSKSWVKGTPSDHLLKHEQIHFDITEYHARLFRKDISNYRFQSFATVADEVTALFNERFKQYNAMQNLYDQETNHSKNREVQAQWNEKVAGLLKNTAAFQTHLWKIYIGYLQ